MDEAYKKQAQRTQEIATLVDSIPVLIAVMTPQGQVEYVNSRAMDYFGRTLELLEGWTMSDEVHPDDLSYGMAMVRDWLETGRPFELDHRLRRSDGVYRWFHTAGFPLRDGAGGIVRWYCVLTDIDERKTAEEKLRQGTRDLGSVIDTIPGLVMTATAGGEIEYVNKGALEYFGRTLEELKRWTTGDSVHPDDLVYVLPAWRRCVETGERHDLDHRCRRADGEYRWFHASGLPLRNADGRLAHWYVLLTDIHERKTAEEELQRRERSLHEAQKMTHTGSWRLNVSSLAVTTTPEMCRIFSVNADDASNFEYWRRSYETKFDSGAGFFQFHPEDRTRFKELFERSLAQKTEYQCDYRIILPDGTIRHHHAIGHPVVNESGQLVEFFGTTVDDTEQWEAKAELERAFQEIRRLKDRLQDENLVLREEITRSSMSEEIVGSSQPLQKVLDQVAVVACTDSTVLISGETGTGKELIARAIHKSSNRSGRAFITVNCGAIPQSLIASELFGHEKGAFTGALQRRMGRFEAAEGGTIFLDEVGELSMETQIALLRVLQEREFERVGGTETLKVNARVLAATNRNLRRAVEAGTFRQDLFYRLNVFPIQVPPLRERSGDIPVLTEHLIDRYSRKVGKKFSNIASTTVDLFRKYSWPGNIRELQNVIERAVVVCNGPEFSIDETWLLLEQAAIPAKPNPESTTLSEGERELIEKALAQSHGRVGGLSGAAAKLGIPRQTLESKILRLGIQKHRFKT